MSDRYDRGMDPVTLMRIKSLELRAKIVVEGFLSGLNRSPYHGFSVEFSEYRQYSVGDDLRTLDWKLFARSDRYYVKRYEDETNLRCHLLLDMSRSMGFSSGSHSKLDYAATLAATLAFFLANQRDAVGLTTFDTSKRLDIPARYRVGHLRRLMIALEQKEAGTSTDLSSPLEHMAERIPRRGMIVMISDLLANVEQLEKQLGYLRARGHEVLVFQVLDPAERSFDFADPNLFYDLESGRELYIDPARAKQKYLDKLKAHIDGISTACDSLGITYRQFLTDTPLETALAQFLSSRGQQGRRTIRTSSQMRRQTA